MSTAVQEKVDTKPRNTEIFNRARKAFAGGVTSNYKKWEGMQPCYVAKLDGAHFYDYDGNKYYDFSLTYGPTILGHKNERYRQALKDQIDFMYGNYHSLIQIEAAEKLINTIPGMDLMRWGLTGSDANAQAVRTARGYTGKNMLVKFAGHFHGNLDFIIGGVPRDPVNPIAKDGTRPGDAYTQMTTTQGRAKHALEDTYIIEWNDLPMLEELFNKYGHDIACLLMEPIPVNIHGCRPEPGYLEAVRELCTKHNIIMIYDEVLTGFRVALGGAAEYLGVTPDLWTFSKALGGGFPVSAYGGKKEIMDTITRCDVMAAGTFNGHPLACAAMINTIEQLGENDCAILKHIHKMSDLLEDGLLEVAKENGVPMIIQGFAGAILPTFTEKEKIINNRDALQNCDMDAYWYFADTMNTKRVVNLQRYSTCAETTEDDVDYAVNMADEVLRDIAQGKHRGYARKFG